MDPPLRTRVLFSLNNVGAEALGKSRGLWLLYYYAPPSDANLPTLVPSLTVGAILAGGRILGALDEVLVGWLSDRTTSRWGRRIPYVLGGMPLWGVFSVLLFVPPPDAGAAATAVYLFFVLQLLFFFSTVTTGPYDALLPELASTSSGRVSVQSFKVYFGIAGTAIGLVGSDFIVRHAGFEVMAVSMAALAIVCRSIGITGVWTRAAHSRTPARIGFREALRSTIANGPFRVLLPTVVLFAIAFELLQGSIPFYVHATVGTHAWVTPGVLLGVAIGSAVVCVPLFVRLGERSSKRDAYRHSMLAAALAFPVLGIAGLLPFIPAELQILGAAALVGAPIGAHFLFPVPLTADVIDEDSRETSHRREATYLGASSFVERTATSVAPLLLVLLRLFGDTRGHALGVRLVGPVGGAIILAGWLRFRSYRLEDEVAGRVEPEAAESGELEAVVSPT